MFKTNQLFSNSVNINISPVFFLVNNETQAIFQEDFDKTTSFAEITDQGLLFAMMEASGNTEVPQKLAIGVQVGFQNNIINKGFSLCHMIERGHITDIQKAYGIDDPRLAVIAIVNKALCKVNDSLGGSAKAKVALAWTSENSAYVLVVDTETPFGPTKLQHVLITFYQSGDDKLIIGTLYPVDKFTFNSVLHGNKRYRPISKDAALISEAITAPMTNANKEGKAEIQVEQTNMPNSYARLGKILPFRQSDPEVDTFAENMDLSDLADMGFLKTNESVSKAQMKASQQRIDGLSNLIKLINASFSEISDFKPKLREINQNIEEVYKKFKEQSQSIKGAIDPMAKNQLFKIKFDAVFEEFLSIRNVMDSYGMKLRTMFKNDANIELETKNFLIKEIMTSPLNLAADNTDALLTKIKAIDNAYEPDDSNTEDGFKRKIAKGENSLILFQMPPDLLANNGKGQQINKLKMEHVTAQLQRVPEHTQLIAELRRFYNRVDDIYITALHCANLFIAHALKNPLQDIAQYDGFTLLIARLLENKPVLEECCKKTQNDAQFKYFNNNVEKYLQKYDIGLLSADEHQEYQSAKKKEQKNIKKFTH